MTIVAGFVNVDGVLICGDTRYENTYAKTIGAKVLPFRGDWGEGLIGFAGTVDYALAAIQKLERKLKSVQPEDIFEQFESAHEEEWYRKIAAHPLIRDPSPPGYQFLVGLRPIGQEPTLHVTREATIRQVSWKCIGSVQIFV